MERAELNLESAIGLAPDNLDAHYHLAQAQERLGKKDQARAQWTKVRDMAGARPDRTTVAAEATEALARLER